MVNKDVYTYIIVARNADVQCVNVYMGVSTVNLANYMLIRLLCAHEMTKHMCEISRLNSKRLLRKLQKNVRGLLFCRTMHIV